MAIAKVRETTGAEVLSRSPKGCINLMLDSGERALLPVGLMSGRSIDARLDRSDSLKEGDEIRVIVIEDRSSMSGAFFIVSENLDYFDREDGGGEVCDSSGCAPCDREAVVRLFPVGRRIQGKPRRTTGGFTIHVDGHDAFLPTSRLCGTKAESLRPNVPVKASVVEVDELGRVILTR